MLAFFCPAQSESGVYCFLLHQATNGKCEQWTAETSFFFTLQSPNESITHTLPTASQLPNWERMSASISTAAVSTTQIKEEKGPGISWSPVLDEGHRSRPGMKRNESSSSSNGEGSRTNAPSSLCNTVDVLIERILIQVTEDSERFSVVDITGLDTAAAIKEKVMSKLRK